MWKSRRAQPEVSGGSRGLRHSFFPRNESTVPQASDVDAVKKLASKAPTASSRPVPVPVPTTTAIYHKQPQSSSRSFSVVHNGNSLDSAQDHRNAHSTSRVHALQSQMQAPVFEPQLQQAPLSQKTSSKPAPPVPAHAHRVSVQSLNSTNTASTSRSSFERISQDNLQHSWHSATLSTAPSSGLPPSTESLTRIPAAAADKREPSTVDRQLSASRRFPLVESDSQKKPVASTTHAVTQGEQPSNALPLPNSDYESPARVRSLRRSKGPITSSSDSFAVASSQEPFSPTKGRESPTPTDTQNPPAVPSEPQGHMRRTSDMLEIAYVRQSRIISEDYGTDTNRATLLARVMGAGATKHSSSTAASRTMSNTHAPRVSTTSNPANPNMLKLKQTTVPRIPSSGIATASPAVESAKLSSVHSPRQTAESTVPAWNYTRSPAVTSGPTIGALKSTVMSPHLSTIASPRTLVSSAHPHHPSDLPPIPPSQYSTSNSYRVQQTQDFRDDESSLSTAIPATPTSTTVRALFSSLTSRPHRNSTPHPLRTSVLTNQPIVVEDSRGTEISTPPPLPPPSTRPDAPQQRESRDFDFGLSSPRQTVADSTRTKTATASRRDIPGLRSPSPTQPSILKSYGLENNLVSPSTPSKNPLALIGTPFNGQRTLMSDSEYTVTTSVVSVRQTTVVHSSVGVPPVTERRSSSSQKLERAGSTVPTRVEVPPSPQVRPQPQPQPQPQPTQSSQRIAIVPEPSREPQPAPNVRPATGGLFNMFRPKSPRPFPMVERSASPAPVSKTPPPRVSTSSPRRFPFSFPINLRHKPKKSISGASVEAVIGGTNKVGMTDTAMSSQGSFQNSASPDQRVEFSGAKANDRKFLAKLNNDRKERQRAAAEADYDETEDDRDNDEPLYLDRMVAVQKWSMSTEANFKQSGKSRKPGVSFDLPPSESERDDSGMTSVSVAPGGGRGLRYAHNHPNEYSDAETYVY